ncbi:hypothetical protein, partial [Komagataeibacter rhaeticus]|uniref:hypothetical protein n=1 Tax=Komagataeibacter rhaeticus TaxID=215221 RepID=UPI001969BBC5
MKPRMFIASSADHLDLAYATQEGLEHDVEATVWNQGVFTLSRSTMSTLLAHLIHGIEYFAWIFPFLWFGRAGSHRVEA